MEQIKVQDLTKEQRKEIDERVKVLLDNDSCPLYNYCSDCPIFKYTNYEYGESTQAQDIAIENEIPIVAGDYCQSVLIAMLQIDNTNKSKNNTGDKKMEQPTEKINVSMRLPRVKGYNYTGEFRIAKPGEYWLDADENTACMLEEEATVQAHFILKKVRFRANRDERYYMITSMGTVGVEIEYGCSEDEKRFNLGNYFETEEQARLAADKVNELFEEYR